MMYGAVLAAALSLLYSIINISRYQSLREQRTQQPHVSAGG